MSGVLTTSTPLDQKCGLFLSEFSRLTRPSVTHHCFLRPGAHDRANDKKKMGPENQCLQGTPRQNRPRRKLQQAAILHPAGLHALGSRITDQKSYQPKDAYNPWQLPEPITKWEQSQTSARETPHRPRANEYTGKETNTCGTGGGACMHHIAFPPTKNYSLFFVSIQPTTR